MTAFIGLDRSSEITTIELTKHGYLFLRKTAQRAYPSNVFQQHSTAHTLQQL